MKKILSILIITLTILLTGCTKKEENSKITIIGSNFPCYDFLRSITKNSSNINVKMLLTPGAEIHDFEPTPKDIIDIKKSSLFVYVGGESDAWIDKIISEIDPNKTKVIKLMDLVELKEEEIVEGMEEENDEESEESEAEYDEHVWTSPVNAVTIINKLKNEIINIDSDNKSLYEENAKAYTSELEKIDNSIKDVVKNGKRREIIFGDRFPLRYFTDEYNLDYYAAFPGCADATEASAKTVSFLINKVKQDKIPVIFHIELSSGKIAKTISEETGAKILEFNSAHNISQKDFDARVTYTDIMKKNIEVLKEALN